MIFGIIEVDSFEELQSTIKNYLNKQNYVIDNNLEKDIIFNNIDGIHQCVLIVHRKSSTAWKVIFPHAHDKENIKYYRIVIIKIDNRKYYIETNGEISSNCMFSPLNFTAFDEDKWKSLNKNSNQTFIEQINSYMLNTIVTDIQESIKTHDPEFNLITDDKNLDYYEGLYNRILKVPDDQKLKAYERSKCMLNEKSSETKYNQNICESDRYILMDCKCIDGIEIADIYDKKNNWFYHNKKIGDLRVLGVQIILGMLCILDDQKFAQYKTKTKYPINDVNGFSFIAGIICSVGRKSKIEPAWKDKLTLGLVSEELNKRGIKFYIDFISYIDT